jgi:uncharacterized membrane protein
MEEIIMLVIKLIGIFGVVYLEVLGIITVYLKYKESDKVINKYIIIGTTILFILSLIGLYNVLFNY